MVKKLVARVITKSMNTNLINSVVTFKLNIPLKKGFLLEIYLGTIKYDLSLSIKFDVTTANLF